VELLFQFLFGILKHVFNAFNVLLFALMLSSVRTLQLKLKPLNHQSSSLIARMRLLLNMANSNSPFNHQLTTALAAVFALELALLLLKEHSQCTFLRLLLMKNIRSKSS
jgi:hypothetical protein